MKSLLYVLVFLALGFSVSADDGKYSVLTLSKSLIKGASVVKRMEEQSFEIVNSGESRYRVRYALTILNEAGSRAADLQVFYDKLRKVTSIEGNLYDALGKQVRKVKNKDIQDFSAISDISLMEDSRVKIHNFNYKDYPYTVEYEYELKFNNSYFAPRWIPQDGERLAVENSTFSFTAHKDYQIRFKTFNYKEEPVVTNSGSSKTLSWKVSNLAAISRVYASPRWNELTTSVFFAPSAFEFEGYRGNGSTWEELGKFQVALNVGRDKLPDEILQKVSSLTAGLSSEREKIRVLYEFLQKNTRYISIQLGIGGLQPFEASFVAKKGYGDCKALSNYMYSLLKAAGINSHYAWVQGGRGLDAQYILEDFPSDQFNHIILCVPLKSDTMWLECTNQEIPAGYMGDFTGNRKALLITPEGGKLVSTPRYTLKENTQVRELKGNIDEKGNLEFTCFTKYGGTQQEQLSSLVNHYSKDKVEKVLQQLLEFPTYHVNSFKYDQMKAVMPQLDEQLDVSVSNYGTVTGRRIFIQPNVMNRGGARMEFDSARKVDYVFGDEYRDEDKYELTIPAGYKPESLPKDVSIRTKFGSYSSTVKLNGNTILYTRIVERVAGRYAAKDQQELIQFLGDIYKADRSKMVLIKSDQTEPVKEKPVAAAID